MLDKLGKEHQPMTNERTNERLEEVSSHSLDITEQNIEKLKELFPEVLTEKKIDFDKLRLILGDEVETAPERYNFTWNGKKQAMQLAQQPTVATLKPNKAKSKNWDETQNLYIEGDNLEVLKILQKSYANKVKLIYLDPPYNTGHDFVYQDNFHDTIKNYLEETGQVDSDGHKYSHNSETSGRFHTDWLDMIYPRLKLGRNLLTDDGAIFVSIDDNEVDNLRKIMDEIFGENNFVSQISLITGANQSGDGVNIQKNLEYILVYAKDANELHLNKIDPVDETLRNLNDAPTPLSTRLDMGYSIYYNPGTEEIIPVMDYDKSLVGTNDEELVYTDDSGLISRGFVPIRPGKRNGELHRWRWGFDTFKERLDEVVITNTKNGYKASFKQTGFSSPKNYWNYTVGTKQVKELFGGKQYFDYPKNTKLLEYIIKLATNQDSLVMDFFSGSATTAEAVMRMNVEDGGNRRFIMVQLPEQLSEKDVAFKDGYKTIPEIAEERICRAGDKIVEENPLLADKLDIGFKVFELSKSNIKKWNAEPKDLNEQFELLANNFEEGSKSIDVVYEIMLKQGLDLTYPISEIKVGDAIVYDIAFGAMFVVLGDKITSEVAGHIMKQIADEEAENSVVVLQDEKFINDSEKLNTIEQLNASGIQYNDILSI